jgi:hypothetical protein
VPEPKNLKWSFGDGDSSKVTEPIHLYAGAGTYRVEVEATFADRDAETRAIALTLPQGIVTPTTLSDRRSAED